MTLHVRIPCVSVLSCQVCSTKVGDRKVSKGKRCEFGFKIENIARKSTADCLVSQNCRGYLVKVEGSPKLLSSNILRDRDFSCTLIACNNLMRAISHLLLAQWPVKEQHLNSFPNIFVA